MTPCDETLMSVVKTVVAAAALDLNENNSYNYDAAIFVDLARIRGVESNVRVGAVVCLYLRSAPLFMFDQ